LCSQSGIENLADITTYLHSLGRTAVFNLGLILGLDYNRLKPLIDSPDFLADMLAGWLQRVDQVQKAGVPTWRRLVEALRAHIHRVTIKMLEAWIYVDTPAFI